MLENAMTTEYELIELFDKPGLFTNGRIDKTTVPKGWFCYDVRGSDADPGEPARLENRVMVNHAGTVIMPEEIVFPQGEDSVNIQGELNFLGKSISLAEFCEIHGMDNFTVMPPEVTTLKLYMSVTAHLYEQGEWGEPDNEGVFLDGQELLTFASQIMKALADNRRPVEADRGIMHWYGEEDTMNDKVKSAVFTAEEREGRLWAVAECIVQGKTKAQEQVMYSGSMFGWDTPAADPARYEEQAAPQRGGMEFC